MGIRCPGCNGKRGRIQALIRVQRKSPYGAWTYYRFTHAKRSGKGRIYCYLRVDDPRAKVVTEWLAQETSADETPDFATLKREHGKKDQEA